MDSDKSSGSPLLTAAIVAAWILAGLALLAVVLQIIGAAATL